MADRIVITPTPTEPGTAPATQAVTGPDTGPPGDTNQSLTSLLTGIIGDLQTLIRQEITLAKSEFQREWDKTKTAAISVAAGGFLMLLATVLLCFMLVHLLEHFTGIPEWAC